jgi:hypothetical protein
MFRGAREGSKSKSDSDFHVSNGLNSSVEDRKKYEIDL